MITLEGEGLNEHPDHSLLYLEVCCPCQACGRQSSFEHRLQAGVLETPGYPGVQEGMLWRDPSFLGLPLISHHLSGIPILVGQICPSQWATVCAFFSSPSIWPGSSTTPLCELTRATEVRTLIGPEPKQTPTCSRTWIPHLGLHHKEDLCMGICSKGTCKFLVTREGVLLP